MKAILKSLLLCASLPWLFACGSGIGPPVADDRVADFRLDTLEHDRFYLNQYAGKTVVLVFWATWCRVCKSEMLELQSASRLPQWNDVTVAAVCTDPENLSDARNIVEHLGVTYPVLLDQYARLFKKFKLTALPATMVIDGRQRLRFITAGFDWTVMNQVNAAVAAAGKQVE
jgi:peroxiredoxin